MLDNNNAAKIKLSIQSLDTVTRFALAILALASGVYTYLGVRSLLDGSSSQVFFAAIIYSSAVSVGIYAFWTYLMKFVPLMTDGMRRLALCGIMVIGSLMIIAMSSWLNAAALAGSAATEQHLALTLEDYATDLDKAHAKALSAQSLLPDVQRASDRFKRLATDEQSTGALTGTSGRGSVVQLLRQMGGQLDELAETIVASKDETAQLFLEGRERLSKMRSLVSAPGAIQPRADAFSGEAVALAAVISALQETSIAPSVRRASEDLSLGFIAPIADGGTADLASRQNAVINTIKSSVAAQSTALAEAADQILAEPSVPTRRFVPLSSAEAVLRYASDFAPSWAGAISIDLLPAVLVFMLAVAHSAVRKNAALLEPAEKITAAEMIRAVSLYRQMTVAEEENDEGPDNRSSSLQEDPPEVDEEESKKTKTALLRPVDTDQRERIERSRG
ncbi:MAG: hypothetical protein AAF423_10250 [Pseudomonadota bacterium]